MAIRRPHTVAILLAALPLLAAAVPPAGTGPPVSAAAEVAAAPVAPQRTTTCPPAPSGMLHQHGGPLHTVAITIDDGPDPDGTPAVLDVLRRHDVRATFYVIGRRVERHPDLARRIVTEGHLIANHTHTHPTAPTSMDELPAADRERELDRATAAIRHATGVTPCHFRAPQGRSHTELTQQLAHQRDMVVAHWTRSSLDAFQPPQHDPAWIRETVRRVTTDLPDRPILLWHDGWPRDHPRPNTPAALDQTLSILTARGYGFVDPLGNPIPPVDPALRELCPPALRVDASFTDLSAGHTHRHAIVCAADRGLVTGHTPRRFAPDETLTRGQAVTLLDRIVHPDGAPRDPDAEHRFGDVAGTTHAPAIGRLAAAGAVSGDADGRFRPDEPVSRAQLATLLARTLTGLLDVELAGTRTFTDVDAAATHADAIGKLAAAGILTGRPDGRFESDAPLSRAQAATVLLRTIAALTP